MNSSAGSGDIGRKSAVGGLVRIASQVLQLAIGVMALMILGRLLAPAAFGVREILIVSMSFFRIFRDFGVPYAVTNARTIELASIDKVFWMHALWSLATAGLILLTAPLLAWWFREPVMLSALPVLAISVLISGLGTIPKSLMLRQLLHTKLAIVDVLAMAGAVATALAMASLGFGPWALIAEIAAFNIFESMFLWWLCGWSPRIASLRENGSEVANLLRYSAGTTIDRLINHLGRNSDRYLVGRLGSLADVGYYGVATRWSLTPSRQAYLPLLSIAVAGLSRVQEDPVRYRHFFRQGMRPVYLITVPALLFMAFQTRELVLFVVGEQWIPAVIYFRILSVAALFESVHRVTKMLYLSEGETRRQVQWGFLYTIATLACVLVGSYWETIGIAWGFLVATIALTFPAITFCTKQSHVQPTDFWLVIWRPLLAALFAALVCKMIPPVHSDYGIWLSFPIQALFFGCLYVITLLFLPGGLAEAGQLATSVRRIVRSH